jgi:ABC-type phosphate transport system substrate-binding protein
MKTFNHLPLAAVLMLAAAAARADVVVVVSARSAVTQLSKDQVTDIFLGQGGSQEPIDQDAAAMREEFYSKVTGRSAAQVKTHWAKLSFSGKGTPPKSVGGDEDVKKALAANPNAIGYIDKSKVDASVKTVFAP